MTALSSDQDSSMSAEIESTIVLLLSAARSKHCGLQVNDIVNNCKETKTESVGMEVVSKLLRCSTNTDGYEKDQFIADIVGYCSDALKSKKSNTSQLRDTLLTILLHAIPDGVNAKSKLSFPVDRMFELWTLVAENLNTKLAVDFCLRLEDLFAQRFDALDSDSTWEVYQQMCRLSPVIFVDLCIRTLHVRVETGRGIGSRLIEKMLEYDCSNFASLSNLFAGIASDAKMASIWSSGHFDSIAATFVLQTSKQKAAAGIVATEAFSTAAAVIGHRFLTLFDHEDIKVPFEVLLDVLGVLSSARLILPEMQKCLQDTFFKLERGSIALVVDHETKLLHLAISVESLLKEQAATESLLKNILMRCCRLLPKHTKKMLRLRGDSESLCVESLVELFSSLIESCEFGDENLPSEVANSCIVACLKYGMMDASEIPLSSALGGCLKVVRMMMSKSHSSGSSAVLGSLTPSQVHAMAVSHSSFHGALSCSGGQGPQQLELIKLLICTLSISGNEVMIDSETLTIILSVYKASNSVVDTLLRRLLFLYEQSGSLKDEVSMDIFLHSC